ncbi:MAG: M13 family metallopeptidase [Bacteroidetes bacterium]|nr:M13 family metallopeptidase [Bacteroidota bacterium]
MQKAIIYAGSILLSCAAVAQKLTPGINLAYIDSSVSPRNDIYKFANGKWLKTQQIPASDASWGSFNEIYERNVINLKKLLEEVSKNTAAAPGSNAQKLRDFYLLAIDSSRADKEGIKPITPELAMIDAIKSKEDLLRVSASLNKKSISGMVGFYVYTDFKNSNVNMTYLGQTGLGLPDKDFYFEPPYEAIKNEYREHIVRMFECLGNTPDVAKANADIVMNIETELAKNSQNAVEQRDVQKQYNPYTKAELQKQTPNIAWDAYFSSVGIATPENLVINQPKFYEGLNTLMNSISVNDWKVFLKWKLISEAAPYLSDNFVKESFKFNGTVLSGKKQMKPRYKRAQAATDAALGEALGQLYVAKYFNADAKKRVNTMVDNLIAAYRERINTRDWMSPETKKQAQQKLDKIIRKLGFPDKWIDYTPLTIGKNSYWENQANANMFQYKRMLDKIGKPVDRMEWGMTPPTVNAYYNPTSNEIAFPAGIMQVPFFDPHADDAFNYGCMGAIIGHELTHGFDDQGSQFDADGNLKMWWTEADYKNFTDKTKLIIDQFNQYIAIDTLHVNGELNQGENIADLGGLTMSYYAYKKSLNGKKSPVMAGFTGEQRFFLAWAQGWKTLMRDAYLKQMVATNPHAPGNFRAFAPLTNMTEFYDAFGVKEGDGMWKPADKRVNIW